LPEQVPDPIAGTAVIKLHCEAPPRQELGAGYVVI
jgi:hypothetical protein